jgi:hypothetical protein
MLRNELQSTADWAKTKRNNKTQSADCNNLFLTSGLHNPRPEQETSTNAVTGTRSQWSQDCRSGKWVETTDFLTGEWTWGSYPQFRFLSRSKAYLPCGCALRWALLVMALLMSVLACQGVAAVAAGGSREDAAVAAAGTGTASGRPCDHT